MARPIFDSPELAFWARYVACLSSHSLAKFHQGGFARVYEVEDRNQRRVACKVVTRSSLATKKTKTKVFSSVINEIRWLTSSL